MLLQLVFTQTIFANYTKIYKYNKHNIKNSRITITDTTYTA